MFLRMSREGHDYGNASFTIYPISDWFVVRYPIKRRMNVHKDNMRTVKEPHL